MKRLVCQSSSTDVVAYTFKAGVTNLYLTESYFLGTE